MLNRTFAALTAATLLAAPTLAFGQATGDAAEGEGVFRQCQACHVVVNEAGDTLAGRNAQVGPNLYGVANRQAGVVEDYRGYSDAMVEAGEAGLVWDEEEFVAYLADPTGYLREYLDNNRARGNMAYRVRSEDDAINVYAYLASLAEGES